MCSERFPRGLVSAVLKHACRLTLGQERVQADCHALWQSYLGMGGSVFLFNGVRVDEHICEMRVLWLFCLLPCDLRGRAGAGHRCPSMFLLDAFKHLPSSEISNIFPEGFSVSLGMSTGHLGLAQKSKCTVGANELFRYMLGLYCCFLIAPCLITFRNIHWEKTQQQQLYLWYKIQIRDVKSWK